MKSLAPSQERWFSERAVSLARGAESEEAEWCAAWGLEKRNRSAVKEGGGYAGSVGIDWMGAWLKEKEAGGGV